MDENVSIFSNPRARIAIVGGISLLIYVICVYAGRDSVNSTTDLVRDVALFVLGIFFWLFFFSQFVLPVRTMTDRLRIFERLLAYITGGHGPAVFIENGRIRAKENELQKHGPGVIWLDSASAAVLRNATAFTRAVGPGVVFNHNGEYIAGTMDLHQVAENIGPDADEDPFAPKVGEQPEYEKIQERRWSTSAMTRDGIEVVAAMGASFHTEAGRNDSPSAFSYNAQAVYDYITSNLKPNSSPTEPVWSRLPAQLAVDIWRAYLRKYTLSQLFEIPSDQTENLTVLQLIQKMINQRMNSAEVDELDDFGRKTGRQILSPEYPRLKEMGIRAGASIRRLYFKPDVEEQLVKQWPATWLRNAQRERDLIEQQLSMQDRLGQEDAPREFATEASHHFSRSVPKDAWEALEMLLLGTWQGIQHYDLNQWTTSESRELREMIQWLREERGIVDDSPA